MKKTTFTTNKLSWLERIHIDGFLLFSLGCLMGIGLLTIYSSGGQDWDLVNRQLVRLSLALFIMVLLAQIPIMAFRRVAIYFYSIGIILLLAVLLLSLIHI